MPHLLEWSRAYTHRLDADSAAALKARAPEVAQRLQRELASGELPFISMPFRAKLEVEMAPLIPRIKAYKHMLVLGIGGSALGARAMQQAFAPGQDGPNHRGPCLWIADNVCAERFEALLGKLTPAETVVVCISKSGGTIETISQYFLVRDWLKASVGEGWHDQMIVVTDERKGYLREEANRYGLTALEVPDYLGGRYSALSAVGLLPAAFLGIDWQALLDGAADVARPLLQNPEQVAEHVRMRMAQQICGDLAQGGVYDHLGGGFARYSTDDRWFAPHFEKMLYDNALLAMAYAKAYGLTGRGLYGYVVQRILGYVEAELTHGGGGFCNV